MSASSTPITAQKAFFENTVKEEKIELFTNQYSLTNPDDKCRDSDEKTANAAKQQYFETVVTALNQQKDEIRFFQSSSFTFAGGSTRPYYIRLNMPRLKLEESTPQVFRLKKDAIIDINDIQFIDLPWTMKELREKGKEWFTLNNPTIHKPLARPNP